MMTSAKSFVTLMCLFLEKIAALNFSSSVHQENSFISVKIGENLTLPCFFNRGHISARLYWYKYILGQKPRIISLYYMSQKSVTFSGEFNNNPCFTLDNDNNKDDLTITNLHISDSTTYYCISNYMYSFEFIESITVSVKGLGSNIPVSVYQSASETIQPGGSVTLICTVQTGTCDGQHSVYWFRNSAESHRGLIYTQGGRKDQCERNTDTQTHTCVYNLSLKSLNLSHAGTYYCAVASYGHILFGDRTKLDFQHETDLVYFWRGALAFTTILAVLLSFSVCMMAKRNSCLSSDKLYYAALNVDLHKRSRKQQDQTWSECVYYSVKQ
uniref:Ig-like domain-containing protein n=1 Tax=Mola mola TaxID=94237 RepID=A0A3Q3VY95_MOLML